MIPVKHGKSITKPKEQIMSPYHKKKKKKLSGSKQKYLFEAQYNSWHMKINPSDVSCV